MKMVSILLVSFIVSASTYATKPVVPTDSTVGNCSQILSKLGFRHTYIKNRMILASMSGVSIYNHGGIQSGSVQEVDGLSCKFFPSEKIGNAAVAQDQASAAMTNIKLGIQGRLATPYTWSPKEIENAEACVKLFGPYSKSDGDELSAVIAKWKQQKSGSIITPTEIEVDAGGQLIEKKPQGNGR